jgi:hypothetical protein
MTNEVIDVFRIRCEARALLWQCGEYHLHDAVDELQAAAQQYGLIALIGQNAVQAMISASFADVRDDSENIDYGINITESISAKSTLDAAAWLWFQVGDEIRFQQWMRGHSAAERAAIMQHLDQIEAKHNAKNGG